MQNLYLLIRIKHIRIFTAYC